MSPITTGHPTWFVRIEAVGDTAAATSNKLIRWTSAPAPSWDVDNLYRHALGEDSLTMAAQSIDPRTGKASSGGCDFELIVREQDEEEVRDIFGRLFFQDIGTLSQPISGQGATSLISIPGFTTGVLGQKVFINREVFTLGVKQPFPNNFQYAASPRAQLETTAQRHRELVPVYTVLKVKDRRRVTVGYYPEDATSYADEIDFASYQLWEGGQTGMASYRFECDGFTAVLVDAELFKDQWVGKLREGPRIAEDVGPVRWVYVEHKPDYRNDTVQLPETLRSARSDANGGSAGERGGVGANPVVGDIFDVSLDGTIYRAQVVLFSSVIGIVTDFLALVDLFDLPFGGVPINITPQTDISRIDCREVIASQTGGPSNNGSGTNQIPLGSGGNSHPLIIWLQVATSTSDGSNGAYDTGIDLGLRIPLSWIDVDAATGIVDTDGETVRAERFFVGREEDPAEALKKLDEELLIPAGIQRTESVDGRLSFTRITDSDYLTEAVSVGEDELIFAVDIDESFNFARTLDKLLISYDRDGSGKTRRIPISDNQNTDERLGPEDKRTINGGSFQSLDLVRGIGISYLVRWRVPLPGLAFATTMLINVRAGDAVNLTTLAVLGFDRTTGEPVEGVADSRVLITSRTPDIVENQIVYTGLHLGIRDIESANVAPSFRISGVNTGESVPVDAAFFVGTDHIRGYTDDIDPWRVGESAQVIDGGDMSIKEAGLVIFSLVSGTVVLTGLTVATVAGDFIVPDDYDTGTTRQKDRWIYYAGAGLGVGLDPPKQYEG